LLSRQLNPQAERVGIDVGVGVLPLNQRVAALVHDRLSRNTFSAQLRLRRGAETDGQS
jgi:hypothetical protein